MCTHIPSGELTLWHSNWQWPFLMGKTHYKWPFSIAMLVHQRMYIYIYIYIMQVCKWYIYICIDVNVYNDVITCDFHIHICIDIHTHAYVLNKPCSATAGRCSPREFVTTVRGTKNPTRRCPGARVEAPADWCDIRRITLWWTNIAMERSTIFNGKTHYFDWAIFKFANC